MTIFPFVDVFLMHLWGEMNSISSYSSAIFESLNVHFNNFPSDADATASEMTFC